MKHEKESQLSKYCENPHSPIMQLNTHLSVVVLEKEFGEHYSKETFFSI